jgi:hypothetical protein
MIDNIKHLKQSAMTLPRARWILILCAILCSGCDFPPEGAENIREQLQAQLSKGQVYIIHSSEELSYVIKNSNFNMLPETEREKLVGSVEKETLEVLVKNQNYKHIRIYFLGAGTAGIKEPYICRTTFKACMKIKQQGES